MGVRNWWEIMNKWLIMEIQKFLKEEGLKWTLGCQVKGVEIKDIGIRLDS